MKIIAISAGHHPISPGNRYKNTTEHAEAVIWAAYIADYLDEFGVQVPACTTKGRLEYLNTLGNNLTLAVEIHFDEPNDNNIARILYAPGNDKAIKAAIIIQEALISSLGCDCKAEEGWYKGDINRGVDFFIRRSPVPALIIVPGAIDKLCNTTKTRQITCQVIASALLEAIGFL